MIPVQLSLKGINSYQKEQSIDFTQLMEGQIFGIFGAVGSGKSTILEAISYALYGETERMNSRDNRAYNMMNLKSNEMLIDFIFKSADEKEYRCIVKANRSKSDFEKVTPVRTAYKKDNENWTAIETGEIENIIGLNYDNFRRTIIIPQGKFSEFLQLGDTDRTQMLKEIFHLERFEMFYKVASIEKKNNETKNILKGRIEQFGDIKEEDLLVKEQELIEFQQQDRSLKKELDHVVKLERQQQQLNEVFHKLNAQKILVAQLELKQEFYLLLEANVNSYEYCLLNFKGLMDKKSDALSSIKQSESKLAEALKLKEVLVNDISENEKTFFECKSAYDKKDFVQTQIDELHKIAGAKILSGEIKVLEERLKKGAEFVEKSSAESALLLSSRNKLNEELKNQKQQIPDIAELSELKAWFTMKKGLLQMKENYANEIEYIKASIASQGKKKELVFSSEIVKLIRETPGLLSYKELLDLFNKIIKDTFKEIKTTENELEHLLIQSKLEDYALDLKEEEPCPLCGSMHHPDILSIENVKSQLARCRQKKIELEARLQSLDFAIGEIKIIQTRLDSDEELLEKARQKLIVEEEKVEAHYNSFNFSKYKTEDEHLLQSEMNLAQKLRAEIKNTEEKLDKINLQLEQELKNKEKYISAVQKIDLELNSRKTEMNTILKLLKILKYEEYIKISEQEIISKAKELAQEAKTVEEQYFKLEKKLYESRQKRDELSGQIREGEKNIDLFIKSFEEADKLLQEKVKKSKFDSIDKIEKIFKSDLDLDVAKEKLTIHKQALHTSLEQLKAFQKETEGKDFSHEQYQQILHKIESLKSREALVKEEIGKYRSLIDDLKRNIEEKKKLEKEHASLELKAEDINTLKQLFKGGGFVNYISSMFLQNLCNAGNERFYKLTRQKLRLELTEKNNFQVRDFLNNGQVRSVKTLSGGQTFQAALSLALALAESIQQQSRAKQNFFFLDEGFGSQDKESLQIVFDTLKSLRKENRIVGVISHVEDLQQEIDMNLHIYNDEEQGSLIKRSWEN